MTKLTTWQATIQDDDAGAAIISPVLTVRVDGPSGAIADLFDLSGAAIANPITGGTDGFVQFQIRPGRYWMQAADGGTFSSAWYVDAVSAPTPEFLITVGEDGSTLSDALELASALIPKYRGSGQSLIVNIPTGTTISEQIVIDGVDLSFVQITADDATVTVDRSALTTAIDSDPNDASPASNYPFICGRNGARMPRIGCLFSMDTSGTASGRDGILLLTGASAVIDPGCGVNGAGGQGIFGVGAGVIMMRGASFQNAGNGWSGNGRGGWFRGCAFVNADYAVVNGATWSGIQFDSTPFSAKSAQSHDVGHYGFRARTCSGSAENIDIQRSAGHGVNLNEGASVELTNATITRCGETDSEPAVLVESSFGDLGGATISGQYNGVVECRAGRIAGLPASIDADAVGGSPTNVDLRATDGGIISGDGYVSAGFTTNIPYNSPTAKGIITDESSQSQTVTISSEVIDVTHSMVFIIEESAVLRNVITANMPPETPDGTEITFFAADNSDPISLQGDVSGNLVFNANSTLTLDNADANSNYSIVTIKRTAGGQERLYEKGYHQR